MPAVDRVGKQRKATEAFTPDEEIEKCSCGVLFRKGSWHRHDGDRMTWREYQANQ